MIGGIFAILILALAGCASDGREARDASQAEPDAGEALHLCFVDGCNGDLDSLSSHADCPQAAPAIGDDCALDDGAECFYCEAGRDMYLPYESYAAHTCTDGTWTLEDLVSACD